MDAETGQQIREILDSLWDRIEDLKDRVSDAQEEQDAPVNWEEIALLQDELIDLQDQRIAISDAWSKRDWDELARMGVISKAAARHNPHMPRHPRPRGPRGGTSEAQSILLPAAEFTPAQAKAWVRGHGFKVGGYEAPGGRGAYHRFRQFDPDARHSYRTIPFGDSGIMAVVEVPKRRR